MFASADPSSFYDDCPFCSVTRDEAFRKLIQNTVLFETQNYVVVPALGSFVPGYVIVATKDHYINFAELPTEMFLEFFQIHKAVRKVVRAKYGPTLSFEHGSWDIDRGGACINHAHLHVLPFMGDTAALMPNEFPSKIVHPHSWQSQAQKNSGYIYIEDSAENARVYTAQSEFPRQYVRQRICLTLGEDLCTKWNWDLWKFEDNIRITIHDIASELGNLSIAGAPESQKDLR